MTTPTSGSSASSGMAGGSTGEKESNVERMVRPTSPRITTSNTVFMMRA
jgi:hypothetical protein